MFKEWLKSILKELFDDEIKTIAHDYVEAKIGKTIEEDVHEALKPAMLQIEAYNKNVKVMIVDLNKSVTADIKLSKTQINESLKTVMDQLPAQLAKLEINLEGINESLNSKVQAVTLRQITCNNDSYTKNHVVINVKRQFKVWCEQHNFINFK